MGDLGMDGAYTQNFGYRTKRNHINAFWRGMTAVHSAPLRSRRPMLADYRYANLEWRQNTNKKPATW
jgi:hypothetical protein